MMWGQDQKLCPAKEHARSNRKHDTCQTRDIRLKMTRHNKGRKVNGFKRENLWCLKRLPPRQKQPNILNRDGTRLKTGATFDSCECSTAELFTSSF